MTKEAILVWRFENAPKELQELSTNGGDEDWLAMIPAGMEVPYWISESQWFGTCDVDTYHLEDGRTVCIGSHA